MSVLITVIETPRGSLKTKMLLPTSDYFGLFPLASVILDYFFFTQFLDNCATVYFSQTNYNLYIGLTATF